MAISHPPRIISDEVKAMFHMTVEEAIGDKSPFSPVVIGTGSAMYNIENTYLPFSVDVEAWVAQSDLSEDVAQDFMAYANRCLNSRSNDFRSVPVESVISPETLFNVWSWGGTELTELLQGTSFIEISLYPGVELTQSLWRTTQPFDFTELCFTREAYIHKFRWDKISVGVWATAMARSRSLWDAVCLTIPNSDRATFQLYESSQDWEFELRSQKSYDWFSWMMLLNNEKVQLTSENKFEFALSQDIDLVAPYILAGFDLKDTAYFAKHGIDVELAAATLRGVA